MSVILKRVWDVPILLRKSVNRKFGGCLSFRERSVIVPLGSDGRTLNPD